MKLSELIEELTEIVESNPDAADLPVYAVYDYGDHCHTPALEKIETAEVGASTKTGYSKSGLRKIDNYDDEGNFDDADRCVLLSNF